MTRIIESVSVRDIRFPTSLEKDGSDATNKAPDYSCAYVTITTKDGLKGYGITFTLGRGNDIVCEGIKLLKDLVIGKDLDEILGDFGQFWWELTNAQQIRWDSDFLSEETHGCDRNCMRAVHELGGRRLNDYNIGLRWDIAPCAYQPQIELPTIDNELTWWKEWREHFYMKEPQVPIFAGQSTDHHGPFICSPTLGQNINETS